MATPKSKKHPAPVGRPISYVPKIWQELIARLSKGEPLQQICRDAHMPPAITVYGWTSPERRSKLIPTTIAEEFARARAMGHDAIAAECLVIADTPQEGVEVTTDAEGKKSTKRGDMLGHRKLRIETRLNLLAKWDKRYSNRMAVEHSGEISNGDRLTRALGRRKVSPDDTKTG
jgi:hypothetical protein